MNPHFLCDKRCQSIFLNCGSKQFEKAKYTDIKFFVFTVTDNGAEIETLEDDNSSEDVAASHHWILPNREFHGQWEHLIYEKGLKENVSTITIDGHIRNRPTTTIGSRCFFRFYASLNRLCCSLRRRSIQTSFRAINWCCCTGRRVLGKRVCAKHWPRNCPFTCATSMFQHTARRPIIRIAQFIHSIFLIQI